MQFGLLSYSTRNIGDEIQSLAARRFLPRIDRYVDRDFLNQIDGKEPLKLILNGWFTHRPENWPPAPEIVPLLVSFHITREVLPLNVNRLRATDWLTRGVALDYLRCHQPIGCRDPATTDLLEAHGVAAYFSGCLTLTLENRQPQRSDVTYCVDVGKAVERYVAERVGGPTVFQSHAVEVTESVEARFRRAELYLERYATAKLVVTSRLHCAMPCLAFGTPVVFVTNDPENYRLHGLCDLTRHCSESALLDGLLEIDWREPEPNAGDIGALRRALIQRCTAFVQS
jgi:hypothetical protein